MRPGQTFLPRQWRIVDEKERASAVAMRLPRSSGILLLTPLSPREGRHLRRLARSRNFVIVSEEHRTAARVHNLHELRRARLARVPLIFLSPIFPTRSHPDWKPVPRMRAAALARLGARRLFALGGMNAGRYASVARLGFIGWAGISAFRT